MIGSIIAWKMTQGFKCKFTHRERISPTFLLYTVPLFAPKSILNSGFPGCALRTANLSMDASLPFLIATIIAIAIIVVISENSEAQEID
jgi:hypothetical protein